MDLAARRALFRLVQTACICGMIRGQPSYYPQEYSNENTL
jgi:hypothetical protein